jgi:hypothetical protein
MNKKAQAAMEFLMTYGWAILVVIAAIAALAYFGVLDPARLLPERCQSTAGMDCVDKANVGTADVEVALRNNVGFDISVTNAVGGGDLSGCDTPFIDPDGPGAGASVAIGAGQTVSNNDPFIISLTANCGLTAGNKVDGTITVSYTNTESGLPHDVIVDIRGRVA